MFYSIRDTVFFGNQAFHDVTNFWADVFSATMMYTRHTLPRHHRPPSNFRIGSNARNHLINSEGWTQKKGVSGGHNRNEFLGELRRQGIDPNGVIIKETPIQQYDELPRLNIEFLRVTWQGILFLDNLMHRLNLKQSLIK